MFGNFAAEAGVISFNLSGSPNFISSNLLWNFSNVITMDFNPRGFQNLNDRPRINVWRSVNGITDLNFLIYVSGGKQVLSPAPTGLIIEPWGDRRTGSYKFPTVSIAENESIVAGIDLFTFPWAQPILIEPPLNEWFVTGSNIDEIKYQYKFKVGETNPNFNIVLDYKSICKPVNIPQCASNQFLAYVGRNFQDCPIFQCVNTNTFIERGSLYNLNTWVTGPGSGFGNWSFISGDGSFRDISNSTQNGRETIGNQAFFFVGNSGLLTNAHTGTFILDTPINKSGQFISLDANYSWFGGERRIQFCSGNKLTDNFLDIFHANFFGDALNYNINNIGNQSQIIHNITGNAFNKSFNYRLSCFGTNILFEVFNQNNLIHSRQIEGVPSIDRIRFISTLQNVNSIDWFNYGMYINNITYFSGLNLFFNLVERPFRIQSCDSDVFVNLFYDEQMGLEINSPLYTFNTENQTYTLVNDGNYIYPVNGNPRYTLSTSNGIITGKELCTTSLILAVGSYINSNSPCGFNISLPAAFYYTASCGLNIGCPVYGIPEGAEGYFQIGNIYYKISNNVIISTLTCP